MSVCDFRARHDICPFKLHLSPPAQTIHQPSSNKRLQRRTFRSFQHRTLHRPLKRSVLGPATTVEEIPVSCCLSVVPNAYDVVFDAELLEAMELAGLRKEDCLKGSFFGEDFGGIWKFGWVGGLRGVLRGPKTSCKALVTYSCRSCG